MEWNDISQLYVQNNFTGFTFELYHLNFQITQYVIFITEKQTNFADVYACVQVQAAAAGFRQQGGRTAQPGEAEKV